MTITYRDRRTGKVADMQEPTEILAEAEAAAREIGGAGTAKAKREAEHVAAMGDKAAAHARRTLNAMDSSVRWERVTGDGEPEASEGDAGSGEGDGGGSPAEGDAGKGDPGAGASTEPKTPPAKKAAASKARS